MSHVRYTKKRRRSFTHQKKRRTRKNRGGAKKSKKWVTAISAADATLRKTKSFTKAKEKLSQQALINAQKLFGNVGESH